jgi:hypothetical protein
MLMKSTLDCRHSGDPGFIVAWHSKREHIAGKLAAEVMTYGDAEQKAAALASEHNENTYWVEPEPEQFLPH